MSYQKLSRDQIAQRVAQDIPDGEIGRAHV